VSEGLALILLLSGIAAFFVLLALVARNSSIRRFVGRSYTRGVLVVLEREVDPRALYFVGAVQGQDANLIRRGVDASDRRVFVWMTQEGRAGDPGRALLMDALHDHVKDWTEEWDGRLHDEVREAIRAKLESQGVRLGGLRLAADAPLDAETRARGAWWVCGVRYEGVAGRLCCDALEFWLDSRGAGLWSLRTREGNRFTSVEVAEDPGFRLVCHAAHALPDNLLGGPLRETKQLSLAEMAQPPQ
jgi:hypothetical protein